MIKVPCRYHIFVVFRSDTVKSCFEYDYSLGI